MTATATPTTKRRISTATGTIEEFNPLEERFAELRRQRGTIEVSQELYESMELDGDDLTGIKVKPTTPRFVFGTDRKWRWNTRPVSNTIYKPDQWFGEARLMIGEESRRVALLWKRGDSFAWGWINGEGNATVAGMKFIDEFVDGSGKQYNPPAKQKQAA